MRRPLIAGNWKLQGSVAMTRELVGAIEAAGPFAQVDVAVMPPFPYLSTALAVARTVAGMIASHLTRIRPDAAPKRKAPARR